MFRDRLREAMKAKGISAYALAKALKITPGAVYLWLKGRRVPQFRLATKLADVLGVSVEWLAGLE